MSTSETHWIKKVDTTISLLSSVYNEMSKDELEEYGFTYLNPAYEKLLDLMIKFHGINPLTGEEVHTNEQVERNALHDTGIAD